MVSSDSDFDCSAEGLLTFDLAEIANAIFTWRERSSVRSRRRGRDREFAFEKAECVVERGHGVDLQAFD
jgi:hypothetical protein